MTLTAIHPATQAQVNFINSLRTQRAIAPLSDDELKVLDKRDASREIDRLKALPIVRPAANANDRLFEGIPFAKYAVRENGALTFWEVKAYQGRTYLRLLIGAPGAFRRVKVNWDRVQDVARTLRNDPHAATLAFSRHYRCCSVCGAELSDERSLELGLGPICRQRFGLR